MSSKRFGIGLAGAMFGILATHGYAAGTCSAVVTGAFAPQGIDMSTLRPSLRPGDDFFAYMNTGWIERTPIPPGYWDYGQTNVLMATVDERVRQLVVDSQSAPRRRGGPARQVGDAYAAVSSSAA